LDGLCGLYAIINALRLLLANVRPLTPSVSEDLFTHGVRMLEENGRLASSLYSGVRVLMCQRLALELAAEAGRMTGYEVLAWRPFQRCRELPRTELMEFLETMIDQGSPVLVHLGGDYGHHTVVSGYTRTRLNLFDSVGHKWIRRGSCDVESDSSTARHQIYMRSLTALGLADEPAEKEFDD